MNDQDMSSIFEQINNLKKPISESKEKTIDTSKNTLHDVLNGVIEEIQRVLDENNFTQEDLCRITNMSQSNISKIQNGKVVPRFIKSIEINQFRAIRKLTVSDFSNINLIVGDNNSGKTTFLEAIQLLFAKSQLSSIKNVLNQRTVLNTNNNSFYTSFINMFNKEQNKQQLEFDIYAQSDNGLLELKYLQEVL